MTPAVDHNRWNEAFMLSRTNRDDIASLTERLTDLEALVYELAEALVRATKGAA